MAILNAPTIAPRTSDTLHRKKLKVRTGCFTCKTRHVKCDEGKPFCSRCIQFGVGCDGYATTLPQKSRSRALIPRSKNLVQNPDKVSMTTIQAGSKFSSAYEAHCFQLYFENVASQIQGPFKTSCWDRVIPQTGEREAYIVDAIVAIGALSRMSDEARTDISDATNSNQPDYLFALEKFGKALRGMRKAIVDGEEDVRKALIICILIFCFQTLIGKPANVNAESGMMLLYKYTKGLNKAFLLGREWREGQVEEDIMTAFASLDLHVLFFLDTRPQSVHQTMIEVSNKVLSEMPDEFSTLEMAKCFWTLIMRRNHHFILLALSASKSWESCGPWDYSANPPWEDGSNLFPGGSMFSTPREPALHLLPESQKYRNEVKQWSRASTKIFKQVRRRGNQDEKTVIALLQIHAMMSHIMLAGSFFEMETQYDVFLPEFRSIVSLAKYVYPFLTSPVLPGTSYKFDIGIIPALYLVSCRCRDKSTRDEAIDLLGAKHYREGIWDTTAALAHALWTRELEEEGMDANGYIPEHSRAFVTSACHDLPGRRAILGSTQRGLRGLVFREKFIQY